MKTTIIYWTSTGNTEKIATLIEQGVKASNKEYEVNLKAVSDSNNLDIETSDVVVLGCSAMGVEEIDTSEMEPFLRAHQELFKNKPIALFGSYGWGEGEWMQEWEELMESFEAKIETESLIVLEEPDGEAIEQCVEFGQRIGKVIDICQ